jgi:tRNA (guanine37-N1)-methyltransferase
MTGPDPHDAGVVLEEGDAAADQARPRGEPTPALAFEIVTLFPRLFDGFIETSLFGKAVTDGLIAVHRTDLRPFGMGRHQSVDDTPYGGGPGMVLRPEPIAAAIEHIEAARGPSVRILLTPSGRLLDQGLVRELAHHPRLTFVCGRYEGFDQRVSALVHHEISLGDYVLAGGELAAAVVMEAVARLIPGVLGSGASVEEESFARPGRLEHPQWTKPSSFRGQDVPPVLASGDHAAIARFRQKAALERTRAMRPDLVARHPLTEDEERLLLGLTPRKKRP